MLAPRPSPAQKHDSRSTARDENAAFDPCCLPSALRVVLTALALLSQVNHWPDKHPVCLAPDTRTIGDATPGHCDAAPTGQDDATRQQAGDAPHEPFA